MFPHSISRAVLHSQWYLALASLWHGSWMRRGYKSLTQAEFTEGDLYTQANCLFVAGYREAAIMVASTAIRRRLKRVLCLCPPSYRSDLPAKTANGRQYAIFELAYFFYHKGIIGEQLRRDLNKFQKRVSRISYGVKVSPKKAADMMAEFNALRPQLDEAMGRAARDLRALTKANKAKAQEFISIEAANQLAYDLAPAIKCWHSRVFGRSNTSTTDPTQMLEDLRGRLLITRREYRAGSKVLQKSGEVWRGHASRIDSILAKALDQTTAECRELSAIEKSLVASMIGCGSSLEEVNQRFGILAEQNEQATSRDARQTGHRAINSQMNGGASCQS